MATPITIAGHRGMGTTDNAHARLRTDRENWPRENTLSSFRQVLAVADCLETDVISTLDNHLVLIHSPELEQHIEPAFLPTERMIHQMTREAVSELKLGLDGTQRIPTLQDLLALITAVRPGDDIVLNLELKAVPGITALPQLVLTAIKAAQFPLQRICFSSFSMSMLVRLAELEPKAQIGMLFSEHNFTLAEIQSVQQHIPNLYALHPEIRALTRELVAFAAEQNLRIASWAWEEESPLHSAPFSAAARDAIHACSDYKVPLMLITDYVEDMRAFVASCRGAND